MKVWGTKPPPKLSSAKSADSRMTIPRERWSGGSGSASSSSPRSTAGESLAAGMGEHRLLERGERPRLDDVGRDRAGQAGENQWRQPPREREDGAGGCH